MGEENNPYFVFQLRDRKRTHWELARKDDWKRWLRTIRFPEKHNRNHKNSIKTWNLENSFLKSIPCRGCISLHQHPSTATYFWRSLSLFNEFNFEWEGHDHCIYRFQNSVFLTLQCVQLHVSVSLILSGTGFLKKNTSIPNIPLLYKFAQPNDSSAFSRVVHSITNASNDSFGFYRALPLRMCDLYATFDLSFLLWHRTSVFCGFIRRTTKYIRI